MLSLIIKNMWHRRISNIWLFIELIVVSIITWVIIDPVVVGIYDKMQPTGYDYDRLFYINLSSHPAEAPSYNADYDNDESRANDINNLILKLKNLNDVESVCQIRLPLDWIFETVQFNCGDIAIDSLSKVIRCSYMDLNNNTLSTIGAEAAEGCPSIEAIENMYIGNDDIILPESVDRYYFPNHRGVKDKYLTQKYIGSDYTSQHKVVGVIKDLKLINYQRNTPIVIRNSGNKPNSNVILLVKAKENIDLAKYINDNTDTLRNLCAIGNYYVSDITSVEEANRNQEVWAGVTANRNLRISLALLFLLNLVLGVIGTVWLQTRRRISEIGILRSFGALKINVKTMLIGENLILAFIAIIIGFLIYYQYALKEGLYDSITNYDKSIYSQSWVNSLGLHFTIVSAIVAVIILLCVAIGTYLPAGKASRIEPVDALRDE